MLGQVRLEKNVNNYFMPLQSYRYLANLPLPAFARRENSLSAKRT